MISLFSLNETGTENAGICKKPAFWIIITLVVLIAAAAIFYAVTVPPVSENDIPASATVYPLHMILNDYTYINTIEANDGILADEICKPVQLEEFSGQLAQRFHYDSDLQSRFDGYDESYFQDKCLLVLVVRSTADQTCLYDGIDYTAAANASDSASASDLSVTVSLTLADDGGMQDESSAWWLVLIEFGPDDAGRDLSGYQVSGIFVSDSSSALSQQYQTVMYGTDDGSTVVDRYLVRRYSTGAELCTSSGTLLLNGSAFSPMPHVIGVMENGRWRLYDKTTLEPVSDQTYEELYCEQCPDDYWNPSNILAKRGGLWALLDGNGNELTDAVYGTIALNTYEEIWPVISVTQNGKYGAIGYDGKAVIPVEYTWLTMNIYEDQRTVYVYLDGRWGAITLDDELNASEPDWTAQIPQEISENYVLSESYSHSESDLFTEDAGFKILGSADGKISDKQMAVYAVLHMEGYDYENGNTRAEYDAVTMKYFGRTLTDYTGGGMLETVPGTDRIRATGWSYDSTMFTMVKSLSKTDGKYYTGQYYCVDISDSLWDAFPYDFAAVKQMIRDGNWEPLTQLGLTFELREVKFNLGQEEDGTYYPIFKSVKILQSGLTSPAA